MISKGDKPAAPSVSGGTICDVNSTMLAGAVGLTKREAFAMAAMQGLLANSKYRPDEGGIDTIAHMSVNQADALLKALEQS